MKGQYTQPVGPDFNVVGVYSLRYHVPRRAVGRTTHVPSPSLLPFILNDSRTSLKVPETNDPWSPPLSESLVHSDPHESTSYRRPVVEVQYGVHPDLCTHRNGPEPSRFVHNYVKIPEYYPDGK